MPTWFTHSAFVCNPLCLQPYGQPGQNDIHKQPLPPLPGELCRCLHLCISLDFICRSCPLYYLLLNHEKLVKLSLRFLPCLVLIKFLELQGSENTWQSSSCVCATFTYFLFYFVFS